MTEIKLTADGIEDAARRGLEIALDRNARSIYARKTDESEGSRLDF